MEHSISEATLERFARGEATPEERQEVVRHLLKRCETCVARLRDLAFPRPRQAGYDFVLERLERRLRAGLGPPGARPPLRVAAPRGTGARG